MSLCPSCQATLPSSGICGRCVLSRLDEMDRQPVRRLGESENTVRSAIYRMRRRFARLMREQIAVTLAPGEDVEEEVRYLARVLA